MTQSSIVLGSASLPPSQFRASVRSQVQLGRGKSSSASLWDPIVSGEVHRDWYLCIDESGGVGRMEAGTWLPGLTRELEKWENGWMKLLLCYCRLHRKPEPILEFIYIH